MYHRRIAPLLLSLAPLVAGHGGGEHYTIDGVTYAGVDDKVLNTTTGSIQRMWTWEGIWSVADKNLACNDNGAPYKVNYYAPIHAGSVISINYTVPGNNPAWTFGHDRGAALAYMAACPSEGCDGVNINGPIWFKIWEAGLLSGTWANGIWACKSVYEGANLDVPTPEKLKPGKYLFRHEMVVTLTGQVMLFPNCIQLEVSGTGNSLPDTKDLVSFPGAYDKDIGISFESDQQGSGWFWTDHANDTSYPMPGPAVWKP